MMNYYNNPAMMGYNSYAPQQRAPMTQPLTKEQIKELRGKANLFSLELTPKEKLQTVCTHKDPEHGNQFSLIENPEDGSSTCYICSERFNLVNYTKEEVEQVVSSMNDILQTIKTMYLGIPENVVTQFMPIIALLKRVPQLYEIAMNDFSKYDVNLHNQTGGPNAFSMFNAIMQPGMMMGGMGMQPGAQSGMMMNQGMQPGAQPGMMNQGMQYNQQCGYNPQGMPGGMPMGGNPFDVNQYAYQPQNQQQPQQNAQQQNNKQPQNQSNDQVNVSKQFRP